MDITPRERKTEEQQDAAWRQLLKEERQRQLAVLKKRFGPKPRRKSSRKS